MREICQSGSEGGVAQPRHPYPYQNLAAFVKTFKERGSVLECGCALPLSSKGIIRQEHMRPARA